MSKQWLLGVVLFAAAFGAFAKPPPAVAFNDDWRFIRADEPRAHAPDFKDQSWEAVTLPHTARIEALIAGKNQPQWQGICWYRKSFELPAEAANKTVILRFDGAMNAAEIWVNGQSAGRFMGGYLPYVLDISNVARPGGSNLVAVRLDNRDNPITGPKPLVDLDFNLYGGLYRKAHLILKDKLHITDSILANKIAGGGVFVTFPEVSKENATVKIQTHIRNAGETPRAFVLRTTLVDAQGRHVASLESVPENVAAAADREVILELRVPNPKLWSPNSPRLYQARVGIRRIEITADSFRLNGEKMFLRGCNRHQEYPYIGNALSDDAQYRDALKIKEAGFDYIRLSHYPQSPAFLDACDELGLVVMNCLMGWQYFGKDPAFAELKLRECRELIRRDRNHPCVILWEVSLNESDMPQPFIAKTHALAHEEYPGDQCYTCGWTKGYDVFLQARQHGGCKKVKDLPCVVSEYGDWEYFAQNAGLEQRQWKDLQPAERNSRQVRGDGEARLLQQAMNFQEAHNDNLKTTAFADGIWVMFDYNRGYAEDIEASGVTDIFRLPKFGYWFFRSQRDANELIAGKPIGPLVFIANYWTPDSPRDIRVFSNCEEIALHLNGKLIERRRPDTSRIATQVKHPPFTFSLERFEPGALLAIGYRGGQEVARHERRTPGSITKMDLRFDTSGRPFAAAGKDTIFCHADLKDENGEAHPQANAPVFFGVTGDAQLTGHTPILGEAGTATVLLTSDHAKPACAVYALCLLQENNQTRVLSTNASPDGRRASIFTIRYTTDGTEPTATSAVYAEPLTNSPNLRAAILVGNQTVAVASLLSSAPSTAKGLPATPKTATR